MKKRAIIILAVLVILLAAITVYLFLSRPSLPAQAADGAAWDGGWEMVGPVLGLEAPGNGLVMQGSGSSPSEEGTYYAAWVAGDWELYPAGDSGEEIQLFDAQMFLLAVRCDDGEAARALIGDWRDRAAGAYTIRQTGAEMYNGQSYDLLCYDCDDGASPYSRGVTAFTVYGDYAVSAELTCREGFAGDETAILGDVLSRCHYNADLG